MHRIGVLSASSTLRWHQLHLLRHLRDVPVPKKVSLSYNVAPGRGLRLGHYVIEPSHYQHDLTDTRQSHTVELRDGHERSPCASFSECGFEVVSRPTRCGDLSNDADILRTYYSEARDLVRHVTGASHVLVFDHVFRVEPADGGHGSPPVRRVHADYTPDSAMRRLEQVLESGVFSLTRKRRLSLADVKRLASLPYVMLSAWRSPDARRAPLAVLEPSSVDTQDMLHYDVDHLDMTRDQENFALQFRDEHRWLYFPRMGPDDVLLLRAYDSRLLAAPGVFHTAFSDPDCPADAPPRMSLEVRAVAFFDDAASEPEMLQPKMRLKSGRVVGLLPPHE